MGAPAVGQGTGSVGGTGHAINLGVSFVDVPNDLTSIWARAEGIVLTAVV